MMTMNESYIETKISMLGQYTMEYPRETQRVLYDVNITDDDYFNYQKLGELTVIVNDKQNALFWKKRPKKRRVRKKWLRHGYNVINFGWLYYRNEEWWIHPNLFELIYHVPDVNHQKMVNLQKGLWSLTRRDGCRPVFQKELLEGLYSKLTQKLCG